MFCLLLLIVSGLKLILYGIDRSDNDNDDIPSRLTRIEWYWTKLNWLLVTLIEKKDLICLQYLEIKCGLDIPIRYPDSEKELFVKVCKLRENLIKNMINVTLQTTVKSICILPLKLNKSNIHLSKFWFCQPHGEFIYQKEAEQLETNDQYPTCNDITNCYYVWKHNVKNNIDIA